MPREFQIFIKPVGSACNLKCSYCYYLEKKGLYPGKGQVKMNIELLEEYIVQHIEAATEEIILFSWHGGEPALAGLDFYSNAVRLQKQHLPAGRKIINGIQTNGTLIDQEWCRFLKKEQFAVGISIDGTEQLHNFHRKTTGGGDSFRKAADAFMMLREKGLQPEILCVVSEHNAGYPLEIYRYFRDLGAEWMTFLPLVIHDPASVTGVTRTSVSAQGFGEFLCAVFDEWVANDIGRIKVQIFEEAVRVAFNLEHTLCIFKKDCGGVPVVEHNGDFYSCDHYVTPEHYIGNIKERSLSDLLGSDEQDAFGKLKSQTLPGYCRECNVLDMCNGECPKNRFITTPDGEPGLNYLCPGYKHFFNHCRPFVDAVRQTWLSQKK